MNLITVLHKIQRWLQNLRGLLLEADMELTRVSCIWPASDHQKARLALTYFNPLRGTIRLILDETDGSFMLRTGQSAKHRGSCTFEGPCGSREERECTFEGPCSSREE